MGRPVNLSSLSADWNTSNTSSNLLFVYNADGTINWPKTIEKGYSFYDLYRNLLYQQEMDELNQDLIQAEIDKLRSQADWTAPPNGGTQQPPQPKDNTAMIVALAGLGVVAFMVMNKKK
jgi:hypothetical protein